MSDSSGAGLLGTVFEALATVQARVPEAREVVQEQAWRMWQYARSVDCGDSEMECDDSLLALGLARVEGKGEVRYMDHNRHGEWGTW